MRQLLVLVSLAFKMIFLANLATSFLVGQSYLIDRSYGFDGTCPIFPDIDLYQSTREMTIDSAGNIYVGFQYNLEDSLNHVITKIAPIGRVDNSFGSSGILNGAIHFHKEGYLFSALVITDDSTIIHVFNQDLNLIRRYIIPGVITSQKELRYDPSGYLIGSISSGTLFKLLSSGSLDLSFGNGGLQDFSTIFPAEKVLECHYESTKENGSHLCSVKTNLHHYLVELNEDGSLLRSNVISSFLNSIGPSFVQKEIMHVTPLPHERFLVYGRGKVPEKIHFDHFMFVLDENLEIEKDFGDNGMFQFPFEFQSRLPIGGLTNGNILLKDPTYINSQEEISFCKISLVNRSGALRDDLNNYDQIAIRDAYADNNSAILVHDNDFYVLSFESNNMGAYVTKFTLDYVETSVAENAEIKSALSLFPNPTSTLTNLLYTGPTLHHALLRIYNDTGELVKQDIIKLLQSNHSLKIDTQSLPSGQYQITVGQASTLDMHKNLIIAR